MSARYLRLVALTLSAACLLACNTRQPTDTGH
jgi:hypothetical protein